MLFQQFFLAIHTQNKFHNIHLQISQLNPIVNTHRDKSLKSLILAIFVNFEFSKI